MQTSPISIRHIKTKIQIKSFFVFILMIILVTGVSQKTIKRDSYGIFFANDRYVIMILGPVYLYK